ncbi:MAG: AMP-binding protein, partial [Vicinamibacterales bacterium]
MESPTPSGRPPIRDVTVGSLLTQLARALPNREALVYGDAPRFSFASLEQEARTIARGLMAQGVARGERVAVWATNVPEWVVLQFAIAKVGAILVTANTSLRGRDIDYLLRQSEAATLVTIRGFRDVDYVNELRAIGATTGAIPGLQRLIFVSRRGGDGGEAGGEATPQGFINYASLHTTAAGVTDAQLDARSAEVGPDDVINMQYTSGTTG